MIVTVIAFSLLSNKTPFFIFVYPSQHSQEKKEPWFGLWSVLRNFRTGGSWCSQESDGGFIFLLEVQSVSSSSIAFTANATAAHPPLGASTPNGTSTHHFGRRCLETFAGRCSANKSNSMDVISEREDGVLPISLSLGISLHDLNVMLYNSFLMRNFKFCFPFPCIESPPPTATGNNSPDDKFRSRASTEGSLSFRNKRVIVRHCAQPAPVAQLDHPGLAVACNLANKRPTRRMSISLRGASSAF
jgi:hypothetical protein